MKAIIYIPLTILFSFFFTGCSKSPEFRGEAPSVVVGSSFGEFSQEIDQAAEEKIVDLLIVVDNSTSMSGDQEKLSREFSQFVQSISNADYRIGVITTDTDTINKENEEGFYGNLAIVRSTGKRFISKSDVNPSALFAELVKRDESIDCLDSGGGTIPNCVSHKEKPLYAIKMAIDKRHTVNQGFFRDGADLGVLIITDEDEYVDASGNYYSAQNLLDDFAAEFGVEKKLTSFDISIPITDPVCLEEQKEETKTKVGDYGVRVNELAKLTGGFNVNICDPNFHVGIGFISDYVKKKLVPLKVKIPRSLVPSSVKIEVTLPDGSLFSVTYSVEGDILRITPLPPEGSKIKLYYKFKL